MTDGPAVEAYERAFAEQIGVRFAYSFSAGRVALYGALRALGVGPGDEVLLQVPTHVVVANAIRYTGARPVYVDCDLATYTIDPEQLGSKITPRSKVIVLQHTFGIPSDLDAVLALAERHGLEVIEDCVHALGARYKGRCLGSFGRAGFFSTEETKTISTTMGGMLVTDDAQLAGRVQSFRAACARPPASLTARYLLKLALYHVLTQPHVHCYARALYESLGERHPLPRPTTDEERRGNRPPNYEQRLSNAQAALGQRQLSRLEANVRHRRKIADAYARQLSDVGFRTPQPPPGAEPAYVRYPVWVEDRAEALRVIARRAVVGTWFTSVLEEAVSPAHGDYMMGSCPRAESAARHLINLPTHPRVSMDDADALAAALASLASGLVADDVTTPARPRSSPRSSRAQP